MRTRLFNSAPLFSFSLAVTKTAFAFLWRTGENEYRQNDDLFQPVDHIIRNVQRGTADGAGGQRDALIGDLVTPMSSVSKLGSAIFMGIPPFSSLAKIIIS